MPDQDMSIQDMFKVRDALEMLCGYGYELNDMLDLITLEIKERTNAE